jgi:Kef-type K+ transport system membrane component KefB
MKPTIDVWAMSKNFIDINGLYDKSWFLFLLVTIFSATFGRNVVFQKLQVPVITCYMFLGFLCGPYALNIMSDAQVGELGYVNSAALSFIAFSAGAEIYLPEILPLLKPILLISLAMICFTMVLGTLFTYGMATTPILPWLGDRSMCTMSVSALVATILSARSPTSILAVVRELRAGGPITHIMIGITVAGDVFILTIFAIVSALTFNVCSGEEFNVPRFLVNLAMIPAAGVWGFCLGHLLILLLGFKKLKHAILPIGFITVLSCTYILRISSTTSEYGFDIDALLVCISAGILFTLTFVDTFFIMKCIV